MRNETSDNSKANGPAAAAVLAMGIGTLCFGCCITVTEVDKHLADKFNWYQPTGPLSGKTGVAIVVWLITWGALSRSWRNREASLGRVSILAFVLLGAGFLLSFPPVFDAIAGRH
jgi:hypothetical protein